MEDGDGKDLAPMESLLSPATPAGLVLPPLLQPSMTKTQPEEEQAPSVLAIDTTQLPAAEVPSPPASPPPAASSPTSPLSRSSTPVSLSASGRGGGSVYGRRQEGEVRCSQCGFAQNPAMLHLYRCCYRCKREVTPASALKVPENVAKRRILILAAAYGHATDPFKARDVTDAVEDLLSKYSPRCHLLHVPAGVDLPGLLTGGDDPSPGDLKSLRLRYVIKGRRGEVEVREETTPNVLDKRFILRAPEDDELPMLSIFDATYGPQGSGTYDAHGVINVTEKIIGLADRAGGSYVEIPHDFPLVDLFGNPCGEDRHKHLTIRYEIEGKTGQVAEFDFENHLRSPIEIKAAVPRLEPLILITSAQYGRTREQIAERGKEIQSTLARIYGIQARQATGALVTAEEAEMAHQVPDLRRELEGIIRDQISFMDVTFEVQRRVEAAGGDLLHFSVTEDLGKLFGGNPLPGLKKELRIKYLCIGNDADNLTSSEELTRLGYPRNIIRRVQGEVHSQVQDDPKTGKSFLTKEIRTTSQKAFPVLDVLAAKYGIPTDNKKMRDVTDEMRRVVMGQGGWKLEIPVTQDLQDIFGKSYNSGRKRLVVSYMLRGMVGTFRIDTRFGYLRSDVRLGYPKLLQLDEERYVELTAEELERLNQLSIEELRANLSKLRGHELRRVLDEKPHDVLMQRVAGSLYCKKPATLRDPADLHQHHQQEDSAFWPRGANLSGRMAKGQLDFTRAKSHHRHVSDLLQSGDGHKGLDLIEEQNDEADARYYYLNKMEQPGKKKHGGGGGGGNKQGGMAATSALSPSRRR